MKRYAIYEGNMESLLKKVTRIRNKCRKFGCDFHFEEVGEEFREIKGDDDETTIRRFVIVEAEGKAIVNGWRFIASVEHTEKGNLFHAAVDVEIPARYYDASPVCEHCHSNRSRKYTFIVQNEDTGEFKMVGKSCLTDFTHGMSVEGVSAYTAIFDDIIKAEEVKGGGGYHGNYLPVHEFLQYVSECIAKFGYIKRNDECLMATVDRASDYLCVDRGYISLQAIVDDCRREMARVGFDANSAKNIERVDAALAWVAAQDESSNYMHNLKTACSLEMVSFRNAGILASLFPAYDRELEYQARKAEDAARLARESNDSDWVGSLNQRISFNVDDFRCVASWDTDWGTTRIYKFVDVDGNVYTWKTGKLLEDVKEVTGTVKAHNEFRGTKQTELTRCKVA